MAYVTGRYEPKLEWFFDSLNKQIVPDDSISVVVIDALFQRSSLVLNIAPKANLTIRPPKPTVWQGPHRLTKEDWWAMANARNTAICYAPDGWIAFLDDRCLLLDGWLQAVRNAMGGNYAVCGTYTKLHGLEVERGLPIKWQSVSGADDRLNYSKGGPCGGEWFFGCSCALPIDWALKVNGVEECADGLGFEDCLFGLMLQHNGFPIRFDPNMAVLQDRTPGQLGPVYRRTDKGVSPNDKSHAILRMVQEGGRHAAPNFFGEEGLAGLRRKVLSGEPFPVSQIPDRDWYDGQLISEMV